MEGGLLAIACEKIARLDVPAFIKDSELRFVAVNSAFTAFLGYGQSALIGHDMSALTGRPEDRAWEDMERRALVFSEEQLALCFDATGRDYCRVQIERFVTEDESLFVFGVFRERPKQPRVKMSKRNRSPGSDVANGAALLLPEAPADFRALLDAMPLGVLLLDRGLRIVHVNSTLLDMLSPIGLTPETGAGFAVLLEGIVAHAERDAAKPGGELRQRLMTLATVEGAPSHRMILGDRVVEVRRQHFDRGHVVLVLTDVTHMQAFERESLLYRSVLENVPEPVFLRDSDRRLIFANAAYEQLLGGDRTRFYGLREDEMFPEKGDIMRLENIEVLETGLESEREQQATMPNGAELPLLTSLKRIEDVDGARYIVGTLADISLVKMHERELVEARAQAEELYRRFERILRTMPVGVLILEPDLTVSFANPKAKEIVKWPDNRAINGVRFADYIRHACNHGWPSPPGFDVDTWITSRSAQMLTLQGTQQFERKMDDGRSVLVSTTLLEHGQFLLTYSDYTEQRLREQEITETRAKLEDVGTLLKEATHVMQQGLCVVQQGKILYSNEKLAQVLNVPASMIAEGEDWLGIYDYCSARGDGGADPAGVLERMTARLSDGKNVHGVFQRHDGVWIRLEGLVSGAGRWLFVVSDVSEARNREAELKLLAERAEAADKAKSRFLASMGHEIRTPMSGVLGMAELLVSSELDARQKTFVDVILKSGRSLQTIINDILDFARIDDCSLSLRKAPFDPLAAVEDVVLLMSGRAAEKDIELLVRGSAGLKHLVSGDAGRFRQILMKLLDEAIKATDRGHVLVDLDEHKDSDDRLWLTLRIEDTGRGFTPEQQSKAFSRFSQVDDPPSYHMASAGLSLSIVGGLVKLFGGTISVKSEVGHGAEIVVRLPLAIAGEKIQDRSALYLCGARVLALSGNPLACEILNEQFLHWSFDGVALDDPQVVLGVLGEAVSVGQPIEVLLVDFHAFSPSTDRDDQTAASVDVMGWLRKVRQDRAFSGLSVVALVPASLSGLQAELEDIHVQAVLHKPVADTLLRKAISDVLKAARRTARLSPNNTPVLTQEPYALPPGMERTSLRSVAGHSAAHQVQSSHVLIVDTNDAECDFFRRVLSDEGIGYDILASEEQAFSVWQQHRPRVMLIDLCRNGSGTLDFVRFIRAEEARAPDDVPTALIGLSINMSADDRNASLMAGLDDFLIKPVRADRLVECIRQWSTDTAEMQQLAL